MTLAGRGSLVKLAAPARLALADVVAIVVMLPFPKRFGGQATRSRRTCLCKAV